MQEKAMCISIIKYRVVLENPQTNQPQTYTKWNFILPHPYASTHSSYNFLLLICLCASFIIIKAKLTVNISPENHPQNSHCIGHCFSDTSQIFVFHMHRHTIASVYTIIIIIRVHDDKIFTTQSTFYIPKTYRHICSLYLCTQHCQSESDVARPVLTVHIYNKIYLTVCCIFKKYKACISKVWIIICMCLGKCLAKRYGTWCVCVCVVNMLHSSKQNKQQQQVFEWTFHVVDRSVF